MNINLVSKNKDTLAFYKNSTKSKLTK